MKTLKFNDFINESSNHFYPEDWNDCKSKDDVIDAIMEALHFSGIFDSLCMSIDNALDPHIFTDNVFLKDLGTRLSNDISEHYDENY